MLLGLPHLSIISFPQCVCTHPIDPMGIHLLCCTHGNEHKRTLHVICDTFCHNPTLRKCEDETHTPEMGTWESFGILKTSKFNYRGQNTSHWGVLYITGNISKFRCKKWARMGHLDIYSTHYGKNKSWESN